MNPFRRVNRDEEVDRISRLAAGLDRREPPERLWSKIQSRLEEEFGGSPSGARKADGRFDAIRRILRAFRLADGRWSGIRISAAAAVVMLASILSVPGLREPALSLMKGSPSGELNRIDRKAARAEREYGKAIERLAALAAGNEKSMDPRLLAMTREKLDLLDASIRECRRALDANYRNPAAHAALLYCYKKKAETLKMMAEAKPS